MPAIVTHRSNVNTWNCDEMGHMNVRYYVAKADAATAHLASALDLGPHALTERGWRLRTCDHHIRFLQELLVGSGLYVETAVLAVSEERIRFYHEVRKTVDSSICATVTGDLELVEKQSGKTLLFPNQSRERAQTLLRQLPGYAAPRSLPLSIGARPPTLSQADQLGLPEIFRTVLETAQCDSNGYMLPATVMGSIADGIPNLFRQEWGRHKNTAERSVGGAAVEYRIVYQRACSNGTLLVMRSGMVEVGEKAMRHAHFLFDAETGVAIASAQGVAVSFDLISRRAMAVPEESRQHYLTILKPELAGM